MSLLRRLSNQLAVIKFTTFAKQMSTITFLRQEEAVNLDQDLFNECQYSVDQLMELAGLSVATCVYKSYPLDSLQSKNILICCGPGNNGGDGLVAARHLKLFGYEPQIHYPKPGKSELYQRLLKQCMDFNIKLIDTVNAIGDYPIIVDAVFGFSYKPPLRPEFKALLEAMASVSNTTSKIVSVDIPSGWHVETGPQSDTPVINPDCLISLTAPKLCAKYFKGRFHWLGGRFVPPSIMKKYNLNLPAYPYSEQCVCLSKSC